MTHLTPRGSRHFCCSKTQAVEQKYNITVLRNKQGRLVACSVNIMGYFQHFHLSANRDFSYPLLNVRNCDFAFAWSKGASCTSFFEKSGLNLMLATEFSRLQCVTLTCIPHQKSNSSAVQKKKNYLPSMFSHFIPWTICVLRIQDTNQEFGKEDSERNGIHAVSMPYPGQGETVCWISVVVTTPPVSSDQFWAHLQFSLKLGTTACIVAD